MAKKRYAVTRRIIVSMAFISFLGSVGCKKRQPAPILPAAPEMPRVITNRVNDAAYMDVLKKSRSDQAKVTSELFDVRAKMKACRERVKAALPEKGDTAALSEALHKDADWLALESREKALLEANKAALQAARELIRERLEKEQKDVEAVAQGRAQAVDAELSRNKK